VLESNNDTLITGIACDRDQTHLASAVGGRQRAEKLWVRQYPLIPHIFIKVIVNGVLDSSG